MSPQVKSLLSGAILALALSSAAALVVSVAEACAVGPQEGEGGQCWLCEGSGPEQVCWRTVAAECCSNPAWLECSEFGCDQESLDEQLMLCGFVSGELGNDGPEEGSLDPNDCSREIDESNQAVCDQAVSQ